MKLDPRKLRAAELLRLLNSTPLGEVAKPHVVYRHQNLAGYRIGDGKRIDLIKYVAWLAVARHIRPSDTSSTSMPGYEGMKASGYLLYFPFGYSKAFYEIYGVPMFRLQSFWTEPSNFAVTLIPFLFLSLYTYKISSCRKDLFAFLVFALAIVMSFSDTVQIAVVMGALLSYFFLVLRRFWIFAPLIILFCLGCVFGSIVLLAMFKMKVLGGFSGLEEYETWRTLTGGSAGGIGIEQFAWRFESLKSLYLKFLENPLGSSCPNLEVSALPTLNFQLLRWIVNTGLVGLFMILIIYTKAGWVVWKNIGKKPVYYLCMALIATSTAQINVGLGLLSTWSALIFVLLFRCRELSYHARFVTCK